MNFLANVGAILITVMFGCVKDTFGSFSWGFGVLSVLAVVILLLGRAVIGGIGIEKVFPRVQGNAL
jgi:hypothetical protein